MQLCEGGRQRITARGLSTSVTSVLGQYDCCPGEPVDPVEWDDRNGYDLDSNQTRLTYSTVAT